MSEYQPFSLQELTKISDLTNESFSLLGKLDKSTKRLAKILDRKVKKFINDTNNNNINKNESLDNDLYEIDSLRKAIEILSTNKIQLTTKNYDIIDQNIKLVDNEISLLEKVLLNNGEYQYLEQFNTTVNLPNPDRYCTYYKKRKYEKEVDQLVNGINIDPNEPVYCSCNRIAFGDMIACDNEECPIEWFHYPCVNLTKKPRNSWICPTCTSIMKKKKT